MGPVQAFAKTVTKPEKTIPVETRMQVKHFGFHKDIRIVCDAKQNGLGAVLQQLDSEVSRPISIASRYLNDAGKKYSTNQLEMLAVVLGQSNFAFTYWADHFKSLPIAKPSYRY